MNHDAASEKLLDLAYGELPPREARAVEAHAQGCPACREELVRIRETRALMSLLPTEPPPARGEGIVLAAAREAAAARARSRTLLPRWLWAGGVGAVAAAAVAVVSWQLAKSPASGPLREREAELMGRAPPAVVAAPAQPASPAPPELAKGAPAAGAPAEASPAKRAPEPRAAAPARAVARAKAESSGGGLGVLGAGGGRGAEAEDQADRAVGGTALADRWRPVEPSSAPAPAPAPAPAAAAAPSPAREELAMQERSAPEPTAVPTPAPAKARSAERKAAAAPAALRTAPAPGAVEVRAFGDCPGERRRVVERDADGRLLRYVREGERRVIEQRYGADGRLTSAFATEGGVRRALPLDAPGLVRDARDAGIDAPPRCEP